MESEKVKEIKELLRCLNGEKACTDCYINEIAEERETFCITVIADMTLDLINELESENEWLVGKIKEKNSESADCLLKTLQLKDRIAELEKENEIKNRHFVGLLEKQEFCETKKLKQFAERLKENFDHEYSRYGPLCDSECEHIIDETLKEFIDGSFKG